MCVKAKGKGIERGEVFLLILLCGEMCPCIPVMSGASATVYAQAQAFILTCNSISCALGSPLTTFPITWSMMFLGIGGCGDVDSVLENEDSGGASTGSGLTFGRVDKTSLLLLKFQMLGMGFLVTGQNADIICIGGGIGISSSYSSIFSTVLSLPLPLGLCSFCFSFSFCYSSSCYNSSAYPLTFSAPVLCCLMSHEANTY